MQGISRLALLAALAATPAVAQEDEPIDLGTITLTASTEAVPLGRTGATVSVVMEDDLRKAGDKSVATLLARLPGLSMTRSGGLGTSTALRIRGLSGPYIGVRIDGIDVADPSGTQCQYDFGSTTSGGISRIEVLRGSQSALFGSEAIGGIVDITTFRATEEGTEAEISLEAGSNATYSGTASVALKTERAELAFSASRLTTDGISSYAFGTEDDGFQATTLSFYGSYDVTETITLGLNGFARNSHTEFDTPPADDDQTEDGKLRGIRAFAIAESGATSHELSLALTDTERYYPLGFTKLFTGERTQAAYKGKWDVSEQVSLNWGLDHTEETFAADTVTAAARTSSALAEMLYAPSDALDLSLALRYDDHSSFGGQVSGRFAMAWRPADNWVLRGVAGTGFRAPSLYELYGPFGTASLQPETSKSFELGAEYLLPNDGSIAVTLFDTRIKDKIEFFSSRYRQSPGTTRTKGLEITGKAQLSDSLGLFGSYTYTDASLVSRTGVQSDAIRVPKHDLVLGLEADLSDRWSSQFTVQHVAGVYDSYFDLTTFSNVRTKLDDYTLANFSVSYDINDSTQAYLRVENLFDETYQTVYDYGQPGRSVFIGLQAKF